MNNKRLTRSTAYIQQVFNTRGEVRDSNQLTTNHFFHLGGCLLSLLGWLEAHNDFSVILFSDPASHSPDSRGDFGQSMNLFIDCLGELVHRIQRHSGWQSHDNLKFTRLL